MQSIRDFRYLYFTSLASARKLLTLSRSCLSSQYFRRKLHFLKGQLGLLKVIRTLKMILGTKEQSEVCWMKKKMSF